MEENVPSLEEGGEEEVRPAGDLPERLQDSGEQAEERTQEEIPSGTSPPQVPPKLIPQLSTGDGEQSFYSILISTAVVLILTTLKWGNKQYNGVTLQEVVFILLFD